MNNKYWNYPRYMKWCYTEGIELKYLQYWNNKYNKFRFYEYLSDNYNSNQYLNYKYMNDIFMSNEPYSDLKLISYNSELRSLFFRYKYFFVNSIFFR